MGNDLPADAEDLVFRRGKLRKRDDPAVEMLREALANLQDAGRVKRILLELGRLYNPVTNGPIVGLATGHRVVEFLEAGQTEEARGILEEQLSRYTKVDRPRPGPG